jgi:hypothetical protein
MKHIQTESDEFGYRVSISASTPLEYPGRICLLAGFVCLVTSGFVRRDLTLSRKLEMMLPGMTDAV